MEIVLERSQVVELRLDLHKQGISIGDDLNLVVNDQDQFILSWQPFGGVMADPADGWYFSGQSGGAAALS